jgi:cyanate permease
LNVLLLFVALTGFWAGSQYLGTAIQALAGEQGIANNLAAKLATFGFALLSMFSVVGCLILPWLAARIGRRRTLALLFALMFCGIFGIFG